MQRTARLMALIGLLTAWQPRDFILLAQQAPAPGLRIEIIDGNNFINNIKKRTAREPVVEVRDRNNRPVAGAAVTFLLPGSGPGGTFANGARTLTVTTGQDGRAVASGFRPNNIAGRFQIRVTASHQGQNAGASIAQKNVHGGLGTASLAAIAAVVVAVVVIIVVATRGGGKHATISVGPPAVGPQP